MSVCALAVRPSIGDFNLPPRAGLLYGDSPLPEHLILSGRLARRGSPSRREVSDQRVAAVLFASENCACPIRKAALSRSAWNTASPGRTLRTGGVSTPTRSHALLLFGLTFTDDESQLQRDSFSVSPYGKSVLYARGPQIQLSLSEQWIRSRLLPTGESADLQSASRFMNKTLNIGNGKAWKLSRGH
jgi:hypothetical protein